MLASMVHLAIGDQSYLCKDTMFEWHELFALQESPSERCSISVEESPGSYNICFCTPR